MVGASRQELLPVRAEGNGRDELLRPVLQVWADRLRGRDVVDADVLPPVGRNAGQEHVFAVAAQGHHIYVNWLAERQHAQDSSRPGIAPGHFATVQREQAASLVEEKGRYGRLALAPPILPTVRHRREERRALLSRHGEDAA